MNELKQNIQEPAGQNFKVAAFYHFAALDDFESMRGPLQQRCEDLGLMGTILLAHEGINGTVSGPECVLAALQERRRC